ncbi:hypothetical protein AVEN_231303-1 [Araneus ventricosus]|uniref:Uncharacterized protein n=1 Tax=Araneus ventricosus TaxID=182803 RepID=A0A4Y2CHL4_ARAVE|nr:hypothetical protein AVEN_231303-1 [Araneus ventricosus]
MLRNPASATSLSVTYRQFTNKSWPTSDLVGLDIACLKNISQKIVNSILEPCSHGVWLGQISRFVLVDCSRWNSEQSRHCHGAWLGKFLGSHTEVCHPSIHKPLTCELFTTITRETTMHLQAHEPHRFFLFRRRGIKLCSYGLSFHEFRPRFVLFPTVGTGKIDVARGLVSAYVVSRVMVVTSSHIKGRGGGQTASVHPFTRTLPRYLQTRACDCSNSTVHKYEPPATRDLAKPHAPSERGLTRTADETRGKAGRMNAATGCAINQHYSKN